MKWYESLSYMPLCAQLPNVLHIGCRLLTSSFRSILFSPFVPFTVLFCYAIETGNQEDFALMGRFVESIETISHHPGPLANHLRLFQLFFDVAKRYNEIQRYPTSSNLDAMQLKTRIDTYLGSLGAQVPIGSGMRPDGSEGNEDGEMASAMFTEPMACDPQRAPQGYDQSSQLTNWFSLNQQMLDFLDSDHLPF